ncbi:MAG TPA: type II toxin-antitoxin system Phd/YefM family antitoxin [Gammaproteobacteria bacterium]|nr:type II toxin-antitoxin system Phd/YefM family antitoxin [Gammaproteobacteria bacterium]
MSEQILSLSEFKATASRLINEIREDHRPLVLTQNGAAAAVVTDAETWQRQRRSLLMLKLLVQGERDVQEGRLRDQDDVFDTLERELGIE